MLRDSDCQNERGNGAQRTLIYGAGQAGITLLREIRANPKLPYSVCGFIDDNPEKLGLVIHSVKVLCGGDGLGRTTQKHDVSTVLIAIPSASGTQMCGILRRCREAGVSYKTVPGMAEVIGNDSLASRIRDVAVEDVLGRTPVRLEEERIQDKLAGKVVLVTGAAGSIGSELCRQIARFEPAAILGFEVAESPLFELEREMQRSFPKVPFHVKIGSIRNLRRLAEVFQQHHPSLVYHAAAYKHVPMMEAHVFEAIENNFFGTYNVAMTAAEHGVEDLVLISSDKAVRPTSVMGATKRMAELMVLSLKNERTRYVAVRFGNVLGSNGSVIPLFKKQIAGGGPVTVTHPEMQRYFMTVPEAAQLVLQASAMGKGGEIFMLDMGQPVKIVDLAQNLILLSGLQPDEDIKIEFTGIRPGEKLYEELNHFDEDLIPTSHAKIKIFARNGLPEMNMESRMADLCEICAARDLGQLVVALKEIVPDYSPSAHLLRQVVQERPSHVGPTQHAVSAALATSLPDAVYR
jgi:FlaA1/EpsC-like NDP-sugar epimerase